MTGDITFINQQPLKPRPIKPPSKRKEVPPDCYPPKCHKTGMLHVHSSMLELYEKPDKPCTNRGCPYCIL